MHSTSSILPVLTPRPRPLRIDRSLETIRDCVALRTARRNEVAAALTESTKLANY
jgi:hypothetical protein